MTKMTNIFVVDDDAAVRDSLRVMLKAAGFSVTTFASADEFLTLCNSETAGCIVLDVNMPGMDGHALQQELKRQGSLLPIIFLTGQGSIPSSVRALKAGALDYLTKPVDGAELLFCIKRALEDFEKLEKKVEQYEFTARRLGTLTEREKEVMLLVIEGLANKVIAQRLNIAYRTVEHHRAQVMQKTGASNPIELARIAQIGFHRPQ